MVKINLEKSSRQLFWAALIFAAIEVGLVIVAIGRAEMYKPLKVPIVIIAVTCLVLITVGLYVNKKHDEGQGTG